MRLPRLICCRKFSGNNSKPNEEDGELCLKQLQQSVYLADQTGREAQRVCEELVSRSPGNESVCCVPEVGVRQERKAISASHGDVDGHLLILAAQPPCPVDASPQQSAQDLLVDRFEHAKKITSEPQLQVATTHNVMYVPQREFEEQPLGAEL